MKTRLATYTFCETIFNDQRLVTLFIGVWSMLSACVFGFIMIMDNSPFINFGPSPRTELFGVKLDTWWEWWAVALYTFFSTAIAAFSTDSVVPWITNTVQDHKNIFLPYSKFTCWLIIQVFTFYAVTQSVIGLFVALTQVDFMIIRMTADMIVNHFTTFWFLRNKKVDANKYRQWAAKKESDIDTPGAPPMTSAFAITDDNDIELSARTDTSETVRHETDTLISE